MKVERELFIGLMTGLQSKAQRYVFFAERQANKIEGLPADAPVLPVASVGIIGAGTMGGGIAMNFLNAGVPVTIVEMKQEALDRGVATIRKNYENTAAKGRMTADDVEAPHGPADAEPQHGRPVCRRPRHRSGVRGRWPIKKDVFGKLDKIAKPGAILASNTSYLDVDEIAASTSSVPKACSGTHFFSPANVMRLFEVVRGAKTDTAVLATAMATAKKIGKVAVVSGVCHGFIGNRMLSFAPAVGAWHSSSKARRPNRSTACYTTSAGRWGRSR